MPLAAIFFLFAVGCAVTAAAHGGWYWLLLWPAASLAVVAAAYAGGGSRLLGKRPGGALRPAAVVLHLPFLILTSVVWNLVVLLRGSRDANLVAEGLWVGRRPRLGDVPDGVAVVADLTCEFSACRQVSARYEYLALPVLDGHVPPLAELVAFARRLAAHPGVVYLHCAQGHGRSALVAACVLIARGTAAGPDEAMALIRAARPKVRLSRSQADLLRRAAADLRPAR